MPLFLFLYCLTVSAFPVATTLPFDVQGHRGCRGLMPENTVPAFLKALDLGVTTLEMDVVISKDQQVVVSHDPYFNAAFSIRPDGRPVGRNEQQHLTLYRMDYADIKRYDVGAKGNRAYPEQQKISTNKPLLSEVIDRAETYRKTKNLPPFSYSIELKSTATEYGKSQPEPALFCDLVQAIVRRKLPAERVIIQSFDFAILTHWHQQAQKGLYPRVRISALVENLRSPEKNVNELGFSPDIYSPYYRLLNRAKIVRLHQQGIRVVPWTVNQANVMKRLKNWGVDGIITDYPNRFAGL